MALLGPKGAVGPGEGRAFLLPGGGRLANVSWSGDGRLVAEVGETVDGEASDLVVVLDGVYDGEDDAFEATGVDRSGESGDGRDPREAAAAWRRLVGPMREAMPR